MKKLVVTLLVLALAAYAGFRGTVWYLADSRLAMAREALSDRGALLRGGIDASITGELTVHELSFHPYRLTQAIEARAVQYTAGSPVALLTSLLTPAELPQQWRLQADGLTMLLDTTMIRDWANQPGGGMITPFMPVCGPDPRQKLGAGDLIRMGITSLTGDASLRQEPDGLHGELNTAETGSLEVNWPGARLDPTSPAALPVSTAQPMEIILRDGGLMRKVAAWCAREAGMDVAAWSILVTQDFEAALRDLGYAPSQQLRALYRRWVTEGGRLEFPVQPTAPALGVPVFAAPPLESAEEAEGAATPRTLSVRYNDAVVPDVYLTLVEPESPPLPAGSPEPDTAVDAATEGQAWRPASLGDAPRWLERRARITLENGRTVEGRLTAVGPWRMDIARNVEGGEVSYPIRLEAIEKFEVWRRQADPGLPLPAPEAVENPDDVAGPTAEDGSEAQPEAEARAPTEVRGETRVQQPE